MRSMSATRVFLTTSLLLAVLLAMPAAAQQSAGGASLSITPSARADGMGRAFVSIADDPSAIYWNPAGLGFQHQTAAMTDYVKLVPDLADDVFHLYLAYVKHSESWGTFGGSFTYLSYGQSTITKDNGSGQSESTGTFTSYEAAPMLAFGTAINKNFALGFGLKFLYVNLAPHNALIDAGLATGPDVKGSGSAVAVDFGVLARDSVKVGGHDLELGVGAALANLGPSISFVDQASADPLPRNLNVGASTRLGVGPGYSVTVAANYQKFVISHPDSVPGERGKWHVGSEAMVAGTLTGRLGYIHDPDGDISNPTYGLGVTISKLQLDFASVPQARGLDRVKKFSLSAIF